MNKKRFLIVVILLTTFVLFSRPPGPPPPPFPPPPPDTEDSRPRRIEYQIDILTDPDNAYYKINGNNTTFGPTPTSLRLVKGETYTFVFFKDGYESKSISYTCNGSPINVTLNAEESYINIKLPKDSQIFINGREERLNWRRGNDWNTFQIFSRKTVNSVKIIYFNFVIEKQIRFDKRTYTLFMDLD